MPRIPVRVEHFDGSHDVVEVDDTFWSQKAADEAAHAVDVSPLFMSPQLVKEELILAALKHEGVDIHEVLRARLLSVAERNAWQTFRAHPERASAVYSPAHPPGVSPTVLSRPAPHPSWRQQARDACQGQ